MTTLKRARFRHDSPVFYKRRDWLFLVVLGGILVLLLVLPRPAGGRAVIRVDSRPTAALPLDRDADYAVESHGFHVTVTVRDGAVQMHSDCPDRLCEQTGAVARGGQTVVCLPARVSVQIESGGGPDGTTY